MAKEEKGEKKVPVAEDYFAINGKHCGWWAVSTPMARHVLQQLDRMIPPRWIHFVDLSGATVRVRPSEIADVTQCSKEQRAARRALGAALDEERDDRW
jgi:hypothetical protein